jgi:hypothetical protein
MFIIWHFPTMTMGLLVIAVLGIWCHSSPKRSIAFKFSSNYTTSTTDVILLSLINPFSTLCSILLNSSHSLANDGIMNPCKRVCMCTQSNMIL